MEKCVRSTYGYSLGARTDEDKARRDLNSDVYIAQGRLRNSYARNHVITTILYSPTIGRKSVFGEEYVSKYNVRNSPDTCNL